ncbi:MAG: DUF1800 domain-containing protein, partial [Verrucomicrobia bacterium]|nr:DUF1800 domain-containing protein [Verrucomicrobiota bacterium]
MARQLKKADWDIGAAAHLGGRAGFGEPPDKLDRWAAQGLEATVQELLHPESAPPPPPGCAVPAQFASLRGRVKRATSAEEKQGANRALQQAVNEQLFNLVSWWTEQMVTSQAPLVEKMTLFWHGHFATSAEKVRSPYKLWQQNETFRSQALGNFGTLTKAISRDPAMMVYLDLASSKAEHPNENFAREVMELFTLSEGNYTENDIKESARAFTGYRIDPATEQFRFAPRQFDAGSKAFLKETGNWTGDQIIDIILKQPSCARFITAKIWKFFVYDEPKPELIDDLAGIFRRYHYEIRPLLETIFSSEEFYSERARNAIVKSPVQYLVQAGRTLNVQIPTGRTLINVYRQMGQLPFYPPNVKGWDGGKSWINTATLGYRYQLARQLVAGMTVRNEPRSAASPQTMNAADQPDIIHLAPIPIEKLATEQDRSNPPA